MQAEDVLDIWHHFNPNRFRLTWRSGDRKSRIDYILLPRSMIQMTTLVDVLPSFNSDHSIPTVDIIDNPNRRGRGYWKMNTELLRDKKYIETINQLLEEELLNFEFDTFIEKWEYIKLKIRGATIVFSADRKRRQDKKFEEYEAQLKQMEEKVEDFSQRQFNEVIRQMQDINAERTGVRW